MSQLYGTVLRRCPWKDGMSQLYGDSGLSKCQQFGISPVSRLCLWRRPEACCDDVHGRMEGWQDVMSQQLVFGLTSLMLATNDSIGMRSGMKAKLYLIPGTICNARLWSELYPYLGDYELVHLAIPSNSDPQYLVEQLASALPAQKVALLGFSLGAYLASLLALRYPEKIAKLMLVSNSPCSLSEPELISRQHSLKLIEDFSYKGISQKKAEALLDTSILSTTEVCNLVTVIRTMDTELGAEVLKAQLRMTSQRQDLKNELINLRLPVSFVYSEQDPLINTSWMQDFAYNSQAVMHSVAGSGHMLPLEQPQLLCQYIHQWLNR